MKWPTTPLGDLCIKIGSGATPRGGNDSYKQSGISLVRSMNVHIGRFKPDDLAFIDETQAAKLNNVVLEKDDVLLNITGASVARCCMLDNSILPARVNQHVCILRPERSRLNCQYLMRFLTSEQTQQKLLNIAGAGATREAITKTEIEKFSIPLPPLAEQKRIAAILDAADALRTKRREALAQLDALLQSTFLTLFGDPVTNPMGWEQNPIEALCDVGSSKRVFVHELVDHGVPFYRGTEIGKLGAGQSVEPSLFITQEHYDKLKAEAGVPQKGDLLLPSICPDGRIHLLEDDKQFYFKDGRVLWIKSGESQIDSTFLRYHLKHLFAANYSRIASGTTFAELKIFALKELVVHVPPATLQQKFAAIVESVERQKAAQRAHLAELDALFAALQHRAFRGEL